MGADDHLGALGVAPAISLYSEADAAFYLRMATMTGECSIDEIRMGSADEAAVVVGSFVSHADGNVGEGDRRWGASLLAEALRKLSGVDVDPSELMGAVGNVVFDTPRTRTTRFEIYADLSMLAGLRVGAWESYSLG